MLTILLFVIMDQVIKTMLESWGLAGAIIIGLGYLIYIRIKDVKDHSKNTKVIETSIDNLSQKVDDKFVVTNERIDIINNKVDSNFELTKKRFETVEKTLEKQPKTIMSQINDKQAAEEADHHKKFIGQLTNASKFNRILGSYIKSIGCDHIFVGNFHNGSRSLTGIPFCKYDLVAEKFKPGYRESDVEFSPIYKNANIYNHGDLPIFLVQNKYVYFRINEDHSSDLEDVDDILYRRCVGRGIKQIMIHMLYDKEGSPFGFVGCVDYDYDELNAAELAQCAKELEIIYEN